MRLDFGPLLLGIKSPDLVQMLQAIESWSQKNVTDDNIKRGGITGSYALKDWSVPLKKLAWKEIPIPLFKVLPAASTTGSVDGGYFFYDPLRFSGGAWYLEALLKATPPAVATLTLKKGTLTIGSVSTANADWTLVRSTEPLQMPVDSRALTCTLASNNASYSVYALGASLIFVPG